MTEQRDLYIVMNWRSESGVVESGEPDDFIYETSGDLLDVTDDNGREFVGKFRLYYVDVERAINAGMPVFDVFDSYSHIVEYYDALFGTSAREFSDRLMELLKHDILGSNVLILDRLEILPQYRGGELGLDIMRRSASTEIDDPRLGLLRVRQYRAGTVDEQGAQVGVTPLADAKES